MSFFDTIKTNAQKDVEGLLQSSFDYQVNKLLNAPVLTRIAGKPPAGNLTEADLDAGQRGSVKPLEAGNGNGDLQNSVNSPRITTSKLMWIGGGILLLLVGYLIWRKK